MTKARLELYNTTKYQIKFTSQFKKQLRKIGRQNQAVMKLGEVLRKLANGEQLPAKNRNHKLVNSKSYMDCYECHIEPD